ncbi:MAG: tRNA (guanosine(37)-N1)-methyltransferase TrmD [Gammaproteobacteria bacterium]|nr:tRNA (guanosine(37)-N1)-methyltransferase TrmD [Gammaproteobacteria bacterium]MYD81704.1 tRNA (guanosine(37)-N1)-methyltransferase TrmD [Gammaproteobacteria bacterium]
MWFGVVTIFPDLVQAALEEGVVGRALRAGSIQLELYNPREYAQDSFKSVDDRPYGGGPGMVMMAEPLAECVKQARTDFESETLQTILLTPQGKTLSQNVVREFSELDGLLLIAGRYEGVDERFVENYVDSELSIGDYVLSGGELAALVVLDSVARLVSGTLNNPDSTSTESYSDGLLDFPQYTRPRRFEGLDVPEILLSGDHGKVEKWRHAQAIRRTWNRRPDLLTNRSWAKEERKIVNSLSNCGSGCDTENE